MSHVVTIKTEFRDLEAVKKACQRLGWTFKEGKKNYAWYGRWMNDYDAADAAYRNGIAAVDYGKCDHAIQVPGAKYEIGVIKKGDEYVLVWDNYASGGLGNITEANGMAGFVAAYAIEKAKIEAKKKGMRVTEKVLSDGSVKLMIKGGY